MIDLDKQGIADRGVIMGEEVRQDGNKVEGNSSSNSSGEGWY